MNFNAKTLRGKVARILGLVGLIGLLAATAGAQQIVTATVTVTNTAGTTNGETISVNGALRTITNSVSSSSTQVLLGTNITAATSNLFFFYVVSPAPLLTVATNSTNAILFRSYPGSALTILVSTNWATVSYTTNTLTNFWPLRLPLETAEGNAMQTNLASATVRAVDSPKSTNAIHESSPVAVNLVGITNDQVVTGQKIFSSASGRWGGYVSNSAGISGTFGNVSNGVHYSAVLVSPTSTNGVNYGNAFSSPGAASGAEQFGVGATASALQATALGASAAASGENSTAFGQSSTASGEAALAIGSFSEASEINTVALGAFAAAASDSAVAIGNSASAGFTNSTAVGFNAITTRTNQVRLGSDTGSQVSVPQWLDVGGGLTVANGTTNLLHSGTNRFPAGSDISFGRYANTSLANGNNAGVVFGTNVFVQLSGPSGAFTINGIAGGRDGKWIKGMNKTGLIWTIANESGVEPVAGNRIQTGTGADVSITNNPGVVTFIYDANANRWVIDSCNRWP